MSQAWSFSRLNNFELCPKKYYHLMYKKDVFEATNDTLRYGNEVHKALELRVSKNKRLPMHLTHLEKFAAKFAKPANKPDEILVEQQLTINEQMEPVGWFDKDAWCRSIIDYLAIKGTSALLVDYKTGKQKDDFSQMFLAGAMLFLYRPDLERITLTYWWIKDRKFSSELILREDMQSVWNDFLPRVAAYEKAHKTDTFPKRQNFTCKNYCAVKDCPLNGL